MWVRLHDELVHLAHIRSVSATGSCLHFVPANMDSYGARIAFCRDPETARLALAELHTALHNGAAVCDLSWALMPEQEAYPLEV